MNAVSRPDSVDQRAPDLGDVAGGDDTVAQRLGVAADGGQRRPQFVRDRQQEFALPALRPRERRIQSRERRLDIGDLGQVGVLERNTPLPRGHAPRGRRQPGQRPREHPGQHQRRDDRDHQSDRRGRSAGAATPPSRSRARGPTPARPRPTAAAATSGGPPADRSSPSDAHRRRDISARRERHQHARWKRRPAAEPLPRPRRVTIPTSTSPSSSRDRLSTIAARIAGVARARRSTCTDSCSRAVAVSADRTSCSAAIAVTTTAMTTTLIGRQQHAAAKRHPATPRPSRTRHRARCGSGRDRPASLATGRRARRRCGSARSRRRPRPPRAAARG